MEVIVGNLEGKWDDYYYVKMESSERCLELGVERGRNEVSRRRMHSSPYTVHLEYRLTWNMSYFIVTYIHQIVNFEIACEIQSLLKSTTALPKLCA